MRAYGLKSIDVQTHGNNITIELKGQFIDTRYSLTRVEVQCRNSGIELNIITSFDQTLPVTDDKLPLKKTISVTSLQPGVYYVRVDGNNNWVKWFKVIGPATQRVETAQLKY
ncbi:MAG: hypothetical protein V4619_01555 [Bacteroidota bacterium]